MPTQDQYLDEKERDHDHDGSWLMACETCGATFADGIDAGHHEATVNHRVTWA